MKPVAQRDVARLRPRCHALRDNPSLLRITPAAPPRRSCQNLHPTKTVPINWQITWHTIPLLDQNHCSRITPLPPSAARWGSGSAYDWITCDPLTAFRKREWWYSDPYCHVMDNIFSKQTAEQVNADAARLHIPAYDFKDALFGEFTYWTLKQYLSDHITELMDPDILEAFEVGSDIRQLGGRRDPHKSQFAV